jgi:hypothetical protein
MKKFRENEKKGKGQIIRYVKKNGNHCIVYANAGMCK